MPKRASKGRSETNFAERTTANRIDCRLKLQIKLKNKESRGGENRPGLN
jgi:hypothetical protein